MFLMKDHTVEKVLFKNAIFKLIAPKDTFCVIGVFESINGAKSPFIRPIDIVHFKGANYHNNITEIYAAMMKADDQYTLVEADNDK